MGPAPVPVADRLMRRVVKDPDGCWLWMGATNAGGYGNIGVGTRAERRSVLVHRLSYEVHVGPIPEGLHIDHLCRQRNCVRPDHLEPVLPVENIRRGEHPNVVTVRTGRCKRGHAYRRSQNNGHCMECAIEYQRNLRARMEKPAVSRVGKTRVTGHGLQGEGRWRDDSGAAYCSCGAISEPGISIAAAYRWHRRHKDEIREAA